LPSEILFHGRTDASSESRGAQIDKLFLFRWAGTKLCLRSLDSTWFQFIANHTHHLATYRIRPSAAAAAKPLCVSAAGICKRTHGPCYAFLCHRLRRNRATRLKALCSALLLLISAARASLCPILALPLADIDFRKADRWGTRKEECVYVYSSCTQRKVQWWVFIIVIKKNIRFNASNAG